MALVEQINGVASQVNFQVTVLKILVSYPDGFAPMAELKRDMAILATSGRDWAERTKRLGERVPNLDIFSQKLVERANGGWRITERGRAILDMMEARQSRPEIPEEAKDTPPGPTRPIALCSVRAEANPRRHERKKQRRISTRRRATRS